MRYKTLAVLFEHDALIKLFSLYEKRDIRKQEYLKASEMCQEKFSGMCKNNELLSLVCHKFVFLEDVMQLMDRVVGAVRKKHKDKTHTSNESLTDIGRFGAGLLHSYIDAGFNFFKTHDGQLKIGSIQELKNIIETYRKSTHSPEKYNHRKHAELFQKQFSSTNPGKTYCIAISDDCDSVKAPNFSKIKC